MRFYNKYFGNNVEKEGYVLIPHNAGFKQILDSVAPYIKDKESFEAVAKDKGLPANFKAGRYQIKSGTGNTDLVNMIKAGNQTANSFRIGDFGDMYQMIGKVSKKTEIDSLHFVNDLDVVAQAKGYKNVEDLKKYFFIDTYNFFWTVSPREFLQNSKISTIVSGRVKERIRNSSPVLQEIRSMHWLPLFIKNQEVRKMK